jgi:hypothetical protein
MVVTTTSKHMVTAITSDTVEIAVEGTVDMSAPEEDEDEPEEEPDDPQAAMQMEMMKQMFKSMKVEDSSVRSTISLSLADGWVLSRTSDVAMKMNMSSDMMGAIKIDMKMKGELKRLPAGE